MTNEEQGGYEGSTRTSYLGGEEDEVGLGGQGKRAAHSKSPGRGGKL